MARKRNQKQEELLIQAAATIDGRWDEFFKAMELKVHFPSDGECRLDCVHCLNKQSLVVNLKSNLGYPIYSCSCGIEKSRGNTFVDLIAFYKWSKMGLTCQEVVRRMLSIFQRHVDSPNVVVNRKYKDSIFAIHS